MEIIGQPPHRLSAEKVSGPQKSVHAVTCVQVYVQCRFNTSIASTINYRINSIITKWVLNNRE